MNTDRIHSFAYFGTIDTPRLALGVNESEMMIEVPDDLGHDLGERLPAGFRVSAGARRRNRAKYAKGPSSNGDARRRAMRPQGREARRSSDAPPKGLGRTPKASRVLGDDSLHAIGVNKVAIEQMHNDLRDAPIARSGGRANDRRSSPRRRFRRGTRPRKSDR